MSSRVFYVREYRRLGAFSVPLRTRQGSWIERDRHVPTWRTRSGGSVKGQNEIKSKGERDDGPWIKNAA